MTEPLALVLYEKLLPGTQLVNRLQDLKYRVQTTSNPALLVECAEQVKPMVVLADLDSSRDQVLAAVARLKQNSATAHLPVIAFAADASPETVAAAQALGNVTLASEVALLGHLPQLLDQALHVD